MQTIKYQVLGLVFLFSSYAVAGDELPSEAVLLLDESIKANLHSETKSGKEAADEMRLSAVKVEAYTWGIQEGAYFRNNEIQSLLNKNSFVLNKTVTLSKFLIDGKMLMPTVLEAERVYVQNGASEARSINMSYTLDKSPKIVSQAPTWHDYLVRTMPKPRKPIRNAYPKNSVESAAWKIEFERGWFKGVDQANKIYQSDLNKMHKDVTGLYRFRFLLAQNIVTLPRLVRDKSSVMLLDSGKTINLNDVKYTIQLDAQFNKVTEWKPVFNRGSAHER